jgi:tetratricopeptide (TPR) repeat protein
MRKAPRLTQPRVPWQRWTVWGGVFLFVVGIATVVGPRLRVVQHLAEARAALMSGDLGLALRAAEAADRVRSTAETQYVLAVVKRRSGRLGEFAAHLRQAADLGWPEADIQRQQWLAIAQQGDVDAVRPLLLRALEQGSTDEQADEIYEAFAKGYLATFRIPDAWMCVDFWLRWRPDAAQPRIMRACIYEQTDNRNEAIEDYRAVLAVLPHHQEARIRLARALYVRKRYDEALAEYQTCLASAPEDPDALLGVAQCLRRLGRDTEAKDYLDGVFLVASTAYQQGMALAELGHLSLAQGNPREAMDFLMQALALIPGETLVYHGLGMAAARMGNRQQAEEFHARLRHVRDRFGRMNDIIDRLSKEPFNADLRCEAGEIVMEAGLRKEGADWLLTALKCNPDHRKTHELLAQYYAEVGNRSLAGRHRLLAAQTPPPQAKPK